MFKWVIFSINLLLAVLLVGVHYAVEINPITFAYTAFAGFAFPVLFLVLLIFIPIWLFSKTKWFALASIFAFLISWSSVKATFQISAQSKTLDEIKLMTWNVKNFDLYNWSGNIEARDEMFETIFKENPDILCLQEFYTEDKGTFNNLKDIKKQGDYKFVHFAKTYSKDGKRHWGLAIFSKFKIDDVGKLTFIEGTHLNSCIYADLAINETQKIRVYNVHLQSNQFSDEDYKFIENITENNAVEDNNGAERILLKLKNSYVKRAKQCLQVENSMKESPYPNILCGDFNDTPVSFAYKSLSKNMQDAFVAKGMGFGKTYVNPSPFLRIDYVLLQPVFKVNGYETVSQHNSDHNPIIVRFKI